MEQTLEEALAELAKIERQRMVVKKSLCSDAVKERLLQQLSEREKGIQIQVLPNGGKK